jgi:hypothetical protein
MPSKTGKYKVINGEVVKVSDRIPQLKTRVWFPGKSAHSGAHFENLDDKTFYSADEKRTYMKEHNIAEAG